MPTPTTLRLTALAVFALALAAGCRNGTPPLAQVRGKVTYRGAALRGGTIVFTPDPARGAPGEPALAAIQPDGTYSLKTGEGAGAAVGWHRVTVLSPLPDAAPPAPDQRYPTPLSAVPLKYREPHLSGLTCEVKADRANTIDIQLD